MFIHSDRTLPNNWKRQGMTVPRQLSMIQFYEYMSLQCIFLSAKIPHCLWPTSRSVVGVGREVKFLQPCKRRCASQRKEKYPHPLTSKKEKKNGGNK